MTTCNSNTTQCLLQNILKELQDANNAYNWNPPTFALTVAIGIIALWFAMMPLLQGLFFPTEKLKYDAAAIGPWSKKKIKVWDWGNMRFAVTTHTPFLDLKELSAWETVDEHIRLEPQAINDMRYLSRLRKFMKRRAGRQLESQQDFEMEERTSQVATYVSQSSASSQHTSAGWLLLLRTLRMEDIFFQKSRSRPALAAAIPSDISAAIAYGSIETLVVLAIAAGCKQIAIKDGYPVCTAAGIQLDFRSHSSLGQIAAFTKYGMDSLPGIISLRDLKEAYKHSQGILQYRGKDIENRFFTKTLRGRVNSIFPQHILKDLRSSDNLGDSDDSDYSVRSYDSYDVDNIFIDSSIISDHVGGIWLLVGDIPLVPRVFPCANLQVHAIASAYAVQHKYFTEVSDDSHMAEEHPFHYFREMLPGAVYFSVDATMFKDGCPSYLMFQNQELSGSWLDPTHPNHMRPHWPQSLGAALETDLHTPGSDIVSKTVIVFWQAFNICIEWLHEPAIFRMLIAKKHEQHRHILSLQLREVDYWLHKSIVEKDGKFKSATIDLVTKLFERASGLTKIVQNFEQLLPLSRENSASTSGLGNRHIQQMRLIFARGSRLDWVFNYGSISDPGELARAVEKLGVRRGVIDYAFQRFRLLKKKKKKQKKDKDEEVEVEEEEEEDEEEGKKRKREEIAERRQRRRIERYMSNGLKFKREKDPFDVSLDEKWEESLTFFLVFRVILYGALLETAVDNSCILDIEMPQQVVPIL